jgi:hypothetical protein
MALSGMFNFCLNDAIPQAIAKEITFELSEFFYVGVIFFALLKACN